MNPRSGQITVLVVLLGLVGLTISLSVASRALSDLKQTTVVDNGTKAIAAAEAGLQYGLNQLSSGSVPCGEANALTLPLTLPTGISNIKYYKDCTNNPTSYAIFPNIAADDVVQLDLTTLSSNNTKYMDVLWSNNTSGLEVIALDSSGNLTKSVYKNLSGGYTGAAPGNGTCPCSNTSIPAASFDPSTALCGSGVIYSTSGIRGNYKLLRIKPIGTSSSIAVCPRTQAGDSSIPEVGTANTVIVATATTTDGTKKKVQVTQSVSALPAIFDNVIYSGGSLIK